MLIVKSDLKFFQNTLLSNQFPKGSNKAGFPYKKLLPTHNESAENKKGNSKLTAKSKTEISSLKLKTEACTTKPRTCMFLTPQHLKLNQKQFLKHINVVYSLI